ncbi:MAG: hypothetical protein AVDCRST_MAG77-613 [uncultured Chloroflexi bacterium]|uniref:Uncharacterized protein n=1 Tax=uncultured Chloroflexota bacterium TaxID=166587 RepID=A0A6J4HHG9_9CHLR|nr:MAG: hypothetical protein AVDCRST_MAG77-613 [uncultured Chloroflexota bacterium]
MRYSFSCGTASLTLSIPVAVRCQLCLANAWPKLLRVT